MGGKALGLTRPITDQSLAEHHGTQAIETNIKMTVIHIKAVTHPKTILDHLRGLKTCLIMYHSTNGLRTLLHGYD